MCHSERLALPVCHSERQRRISMMVREMVTDDRGRGTDDRGVVIGGRGDRPVAPTVAAFRILRSLRPGFFGRCAPSE